MRKIIILITFYLATTLSHATQPLNLCTLTTQLPSNVLLPQDYIFVGKVTGKSTPDVVMIYYLCDSNDTPCQDYGSIGMTIFSSVHGYFEKVWEEKLDGEGDLSNFSPKHNPVRDIFHDGRSEIICEINAGPFIRFTIYRWNQQKHILEPIPFTGGTMRPEHVTFSEYKATDELDGWVECKDLDGDGIDEVIIYPPGHGNYIADYYKWDGQCYRVANYQFSEQYTDYMKEMDDSLFVDKINENISLVESFARPVIQGDIYQKRYNEARDLCLWLIDSANDSMDYEKNRVISESYAFLGDIEMDLGRVSEATTYYWQAANYEHADEKDYMDGQIEEHEQVKRNGKLEIVQVPDYGSISTYHWTRDGEPLSYTEGGIEMLQKGFAKELKGTFQSIYETYFLERGLPVVPLPEPEESVHVVKKK